jgi:hypothetical protein
MTDEELVKRLRDKHCCESPNCNCDEAADRIEALTAKLATCEKYRDAYDKMGRIGTEAYRDLEAKLAKAVEALRLALKYNTAMHRGASEFNKRILTTLAEIEGEKE